MNKDYKFIKDAYEGKLGLEMCQDWEDLILNAYPEFKEEEFKVGDWVYVTKTSFGWTQHTNQRVFKLCELGPFYGTSGKGIMGLKGCEFRKATREEIEKHLIEEAKRRGFKKGLKVRLFSGATGIIKKNWEHEYRESTDSFYFHNLLIYKQGQWAEIINTMTKA